MEWTPLEYARWSGIARNHLSEPHPVAHLDVLKQNSLPGLNDIPQLPEIQLPSDADLSDPPALSKDGALLLRELGSRPNRDIKDLTPAISSRWPITKRHLELCLLRTDNALDLVKFAERDEPSLDKIKLPTEPLNLAKGQGLPWQASELQLPQTLMREAHVERLAVPRDVLLALSVIVKERALHECVAKIWDEASRSEKASRISTPLTPPLLPISPPLIPYIPSSPACHLQMLSDPPSLLSDDLRALEQEIFKEDGILEAECSALAQSPQTRYHGAITGNTHPFAMVRKSPQSPKMPRIRRENLKLEVPMLEQLPSPTSGETYNHEGFIRELALQSSSGFEVLEPPKFDLDSELEGYFTADTLKLLEGVNERVEQEKLETADSIKRVKVPVMNFTKPASPWANKGSNPQLAWSNIANEVALTRKLQAFPDKCSGARAHERKLKWNPFATKIATSFLDEDVESTVSLEGYLGVLSLGIVIHSSDITWKPPGLRILRDDNYQDEDEVTDLPPGDLVTSRQRPNLSKPTKRTGDTIASSRQPPTKRVQTVEGPIRPGSRTNNTNQLGFNSALSLLGASFSPSVAVNNFLTLRGNDSLTQPPSTSQYFAKPTENSGPQNPPTRALQPSCAVSTIAAPVPAPLIKAADHPCYIIISSALFQRRKLLAALQNSFPKLSLIERDFKAHDQFVWAKGSVSRAPIESALRYEADVIPSPSTGILLTTLKQVKQKPLPGSKALSTLRVRITSVAKRYERLIILVHDVNDDNVVVPLEDGDSLALAELIGFAESLRNETHVMVRYVLGDDDVLGAYLAAFIGQYIMSSHKSFGQTTNPQGIGESDGNIQLLQDETYWELFLRSAGLNPFASQIIILSLRELYGDYRADENVSDQFCLATFVQMGEMDRVKKFSSIVEGSRVLQRVSKLLDQRWE